MPELIDDRKIFSLLEVSRSIQRTLSERYTSSFWIKAEINKLNFYRQSGHAYPDLVEKQDGKIIAQIRANLWKDDYKRINQVFQDVLKEPLKDGIKVLMLAKVNFDPVYGLSLSILDIDPAFTLGDLEKEKQENLERLRREGLFNLNKLLTLPLLPQRIAIISVDSSKGYADFKSVIDQNNWGYHFYYQLYPALLQGDRAAADIVRQLNQIRTHIHQYDVVAIIRGGGGDVGLTCYNDFTLASTICTFPIPVLTGIGHSTNETISEMVAHVNAITPTKLAEFLIQQFHNFSVPVLEAEKKITERAKQLIVQTQDLLMNEMRLFRSVTEAALAERSQELQQQVLVLKKDSVVVLKEQRQWIKQYKQQLKLACQQFLRQEQITLQSEEKQISLLSPQNVLKRGYSITRINGKAVQSVEELKEGDQLETILYKGNVSSNVTSLHKIDTHE